MKIKLKISNSNLSQEQKEAMWATYCKYYDCEKAYFMSRIAQHNYFILFLRNEEIIGFTGIKKDVIKNGNTKNTVVGLAMTVIDKEYRNKALIQRAVYKVYQREFIQNPFRNIFVWSVAATYKPYLVFAKGMEIFYPNVDVNMPEEYKMLKKTICEKHFEEYNLDKNLVYIKGFKVTDSSVLINEEKDETVDKDILYYKSLYFSGRHIENREIKGVLTLAPMNINNLFYWASKVIQKKFKMKIF